MRSAENQSSTSAPVYFLLKRRGKGNKCGGGHTALNQHLKAKLFRPSSKRGASSVSSWTPLKLEEPETHH